MNNQSSHVKTCIEHLVSQLAGLTIAGGAVDETGEFWGFVAEGKRQGKTIRKVVFVNCDPEGNGPGFLEINDEKPYPPEHGGAYGCVKETAEEIMAVSTTPRFSPGQIVITPGALCALEENGQTAADFIDRHLRGDWGDLCEEDKQANEEALEQDLRLLSAYRLHDGTKIWIITEADRSSSCVLMPSEY